MNNEMNLREKIAEIICNLPCDSWIPKDMANDYADQILSLPIESLEVEEKCLDGINGCGDCTGSRCSDTGTIRRPATMEDIMELIDMMKETDIGVNLGNNKRLRVKR